MTIETRRNKILISLTEGDILKKGEDFFTVSVGEVSVYADGTIDQSAGELHAVSKDAIVRAIANNAQLFNYDEEIGKA